MARSINDVAHVAISGTLIIYFGYIRTAAAAMYQIYTNYNILRVLCEGIELVAP